MATIFRKQAGRFQEWHFRGDCVDWPEANYIEQKAIPPAGELCIECARLHIKTKRSREFDPEPATR